MKASIIYILFLFLFIIGCEKEAEVLPKGYPFVKTQTPFVIENGVTYSADITNKGSQRVLKYGFVWGENEKPTIDNCKKLFEGDIGEGVFSCSINGGLIKGKTYTVRACILTQRNVIYGDTVSFVSLGSFPPEITDFFPKYGPIGSSITIEGENFAPSNSDNIVKFGNVVVDIDTVTENKIVVTIPEIAKSEKVQISIETAGMTAISLESFDLWYPWKRMKDFTEGDFNSICFSIQDKAYIGSITDNKLWEYNPNDESIVKKADFPKSITAVPKCFVLNNRGYVIFSDKYDTISELWEYVPTEDSWTRKADFPGISRDDAVAFSISDKGYFGTGSGFDEFRHLTCLNDFWEYNPSTDSWTQKADFPYARAMATGFSVGNYGYLGLGMHNGDWFYDLNKYDPENNTWTYIGDYPGNGYIHLNGFAINNKYYLGLGGRSTSYSYSDWWQLDAGDNSWTKMHSCPVAMKTSIGFSLNNKGYIGIGWSDYLDPDVSRKFIYEFDPLKN